MDGLYTSGTGTTSYLPSTFITVRLRAALLTEMCKRFRDLRSIFSKATARAGFMTTVYVINGVDICGSPLMKE